MARVWRASCRGPASGSEALQRRLTSLNHRDALGEDVPTTSALPSGPTNTGRLSKSTRLCSNARTAVRLTAAGESDIATVPQRDHALFRAQADAMVVGLVWRELEFADSCSAHLLLAADRRARRFGQASRCRARTGGVPVVHELIGIDREHELVDRPPGAPAAPAEWEAVPA